jgi:hypothetical protein
MSHNWLAKLKNFTVGSCLSPHIPACFSLPQELQFFNILSLSTQGFSALLPAFWSGSQQCVPAVLSVCLLSINGTAKLLLGGVKCLCVLLLVPSCHLDLAPGVTAFQFAF